MKANRAYDLIVSRESRELALFWELAPKEAAKLLRALRADLAQLEASEFIGAWRGSDSGETA